MLRCAHNREIHPGYIQPGTLLQTHYLVGPEILAFELLLHVHGRNHVECP